MLRKIFNITAYSKHNGLFHQAFSIGKKKRIFESYLLSPDYDYLKINDDGFLVDPYLIFDSVSYTYDKVEAASIINGLNKMNSNDSLGWNDYYSGVNEIYVRVGRKPIYTFDYSDERFNNKNGNIKSRKKVLR